MKAIVVSIQRGRVETCGSDDGSAKRWTTAIRKTPVSGPIFVGRTQLAGDEQADLVHHGGPDKAVLAYAAAHYPLWADEYPDRDWQPGGFGENLTVAGLVETDVCIGDVYQLGDCRLQVSQPRQPCWKLSRRWNLPELARYVQQVRRTGWYLRVLEEGEIEPGQEMHLLERRFGQFTVAWALDVMYAKPRSAEDDLRLAECPALSPSWQQTLSARATRGQEPNAQARLSGES